ncbi:MAG: DUF1572 domain-containing protein [Chloroflexota bacterium]|nr:DUF1572 domain-containing protein [Chloroflexota bacterium]
MDSTVSSVLDLFQGVHRQLRDIVKDMDSEELNWSPGLELNSVVVIVTHTLGSELDTLLFVRNLSSDRDRDAEFEVQATNASQLIEAIDRADRLLVEYAEQITADDLASTRTRPGRDPQLGVHWLINNYGHAREHLGHLHMTRQLYQQRV